MTDEQGLRTVFLLLLLEHYRSKLRDSVELIATTGCWEWRRSGDGRYGHFYMLGIKFKSHVASAILFRGVVLRTRVLRHRCNNPACCNPEHLTPGTSAQNRWDASECGRANVGVTAATVRRVRNLITRGHPDREVARRCGVHATTVWRIRTGRIR